MPTLHLQVCAGFCNRVRSLVSGICAAEHFNIPLVIHWSPSSSECVCKFQNVLDAESLPKTCKVVPEDLYNAQQVLSREDWDRLIRNWDKTSDLVIKSHGIFFRNERWNYHLRNLKPSSRVKDFLNRRTAQVDWSKAIGIHIRRTDNIKAILESPLECFIERMRALPEAFFVVATDEQEVKDKLELEFGDRCVFPAFVYSRSTEEGMIQGVADFFALTKCVRILGSARSSFNEVAAWYSDGALEIVTA
jgi:hypothetical protein